MGLCSIIFGSPNYCQSNLKYHAWMIVLQKNCFSNHSPKNCHCALNYHPTERYIIKDINLRKNFSVQTLLVCSGRCVCAHV